MSTDLELPEAPTESVEVSRQTELRAKVATLLGVNQHLWSESPGDVPCIGFISQCDRCCIRADENGANDPCMMADVPDYPYDLNACAEFEKMLDRGQRAEYVTALWETTGAKATIGLVLATAEQRCRAFIAVMEVSK